MPLPARALFARRPDTCLLVPCLCRVRSVCTRLPRHYFWRSTYQPLASVLLCPLYLLCTSYPLFSVVVITVGAEILSLYPMPFLSLSLAQPPLSSPLPGSRTRGGVLPSARVMCISACMCMCSCVSCECLRAGVCVRARLFGRVCVRVYVCESGCVCVCVLARACVRLHVCVCA